MTPHQAAANPLSSRSSRSDRTRSANGADKGLFDPLLDLIVQRRFTGRASFDRLFHARGNEAPPVSASVQASPDAAPPRPAVDFLFLTEHDRHRPEEVFDRLRWGGQVIIATKNRHALPALAQLYQTWRVDESGQHAWYIEEPCGHERKFQIGWPTSVYFLIARKVMLVPPGKSSDRFTYHVHLEPNPHTGGFDVVKEVPSLQRVLVRLKEKFPDADDDTLRRRARKFTDKIFPVFLTRETAILKLLQRDLPEKFKNRVPSMVAAVPDAAGYVRSLRMNWLRNARPVFGGSPTGRKISQLEFAQQASELLAALHDDVGIMHLDLRLDNVVITENGVSFVDFGSAVRVGEEFPDESLLSNLFEEMMRTSQIQRMLGKMTEAGTVTSEEITSSHHRMDKAVDFFYLAVQINSPLSNPDFTGLVDHDPGSHEAIELARLTDKILRPTETQQERFTSARDILKGIREIDHKLANPHNEI